MNSAISPIFGKMKLSSTNAEKLREGKFYLTIDSPDFPDGEIAGKINNKISFYSYLNGFQVSPIASTTASKGCLLLDHPANSSSPNLSLRLVHSVDEVTSFNLNIGKIGHLGEEISLFSQSFDYSNYYSDNYYNSVYVVDEFITLTPNYLEDLIDGKLYLTISSSAFPEGEIRGQILQVIEDCSYTPPPPRNQAEFFLSTGLFDDYFSTRKSSSSSASSLSPLYLFSFFLCFITFIVVL